MKQRQTRQLAAVYDVVRAAHDHPTAEEVVGRVRRRLPQVSLGTVYRNLQKLAVQQRVRVVHLADRTARYDGMLEDHDHFVCERCGDLTALPRARAAAPKRAALTAAGYSVRAHAVTFYGVCSDCSAAPCRRRRGRTGARAHSSQPGE
jgi:Fur family peroxide stress response transcriptional regulator